MDYDNFQLSENLYIIDEVYVTFIQCILQKREFIETLFWMFEIDYSSDKLADGIKSIYLQFYYKNNPSFSTYITKKIKKYQYDNSLYHLVNIVYNMCKLKPSPEAFLILYYMHYGNDISYIYKTYRSIYCNVEKNMKQILLSINDNNYENIGFYLNKISIEKVFDKIPNNGRIIPDGFDKDYDLLAAYIVSDSRKIGIMNKCYCYSKKKYNEMKLHFEKLPRKPYKKLEERRLYPIHYTLLFHNYMRFNVKNLKDTMYYHWKYYVKNSKMWQQRYKKANVKFDKNRKTIHFMCDYDLENFYQFDNCMDFDEQSSFVQMLRMHPIKLIKDPLEWFNNIILYI